MAPAHAFRCPPTAAPRAVLRDGVDRVLTARRVIATVAAEQAAERCAVEQDEEDEQAGHVLGLSRWHHSARGAGASPAFSVSVRRRRDALATIAFFGNAQSSMPGFMQFRNRIPQQLLILGQWQRLMRADDDHPIIPAREVVPHEAERFAQHPADAVASRGGADLARRA